MFHKLFGARERKIPPVQSRFNAEERSSALKIIHAGGKTDYYYMAVPASRVMEKYPTFILARPEVFRRPWDSVVRPEEILVPGQKFYVVPVGTVKKLKQRISRKPDNDSSLDLFVSQCKDELSSKSYLLMKDVSKSKVKVKVEKRHVSFTGIDKKSGGNDPEKKRKKRNGRLKKNSSSSQPNEVKTRRVKMITWEPSLTHCHMGTQEQRIRELHEKPSPSIFVSNLRGEALKRSLQLASPPKPKGEEKPASMKPNCLCSPTTHPGSFRCRIHRNPLGRNSMSVGSKLSELAHKPGALQA